LYKREQTWRELLGTEKNRTNKTKLLMKQTIQFCSKEQKQAFAKRMSGQLQKILNNKM
jgi:hypothetical protein